VSFWRFQIVIEQRERRSGKSCVAVKDRITARDKATIVADQLMEHEATELAQDILDVARKGEFNALRYCLGRVQ
jgi:hypothetical protein